MLSKTLFVLLVVALTLGTAQEARPEAPQQPLEEPERLPSTVEVRIPKIVREDLVASAVEFCHSVHPETPKQWFRERFAPYALKETWDVKHNAGGSGRAGTLTEIVIEGPTIVYLSFPDGQRWRLVTASPGRLPGAKEGKLNMQEAAEKARQAFQRVLPDAEQRRGFHLAREVESVRSYCFRWQSPVAEEHMDYSSVRVDIGTDNGFIKRCSVKYRKRPPMDKPIIGREKIEEKVRKFYGKVNAAYLKLFVSYTTGHHFLWWRYVVPAPPEGGDEITCWDAFSGELVWSDAFDPDGTNLVGGNRRYKNPKYFSPHRTKEQVVARLEHLAQQRAAALEAERSETGHVDPPVEQSGKGVRTICLLRNPMWPTNSAGTVARDTIRLYPIPLRAGV